MSALFTLAGLTVREARRRRITIGAFGIAFLGLGLLLLPGFASNAALRSIPHPGGACHARRAGDDQVL